MNALAPCPSCRRHVRVAENACPFCDASVTLEEVVPRGIYAQRLGRAALFTFGAAVVTTAGCGTSTTPADGSSGVDGGGDVADVGHDAYYGSIGDVYGTPDVSFLYDAGSDAGMDASAAPDEDADTPDAGVHAPYGAPPPPPDPEEP